MVNHSTAPILIPLDEEQFWIKIRQIIREEVQQATVQVSTDKHTNFETPGLTYKPLFKLSELCDLLQVSRATIYVWIKCNKLKPYKIRSRVYFLWDDVQKLLKPSDDNS
jgi:excisionase family DNA binding protein